MRTLLLVLLLLAAAPAHAADDDAAALSLADKTPAATEQASDWHVFLEGAWAESALREGAGTEHDEHLFLDVHYDGSFAPGWRAVFADLLDSHWQDSL